MIDFVKERAKRLPPIGNERTQNEMFFLAKALLLGFVAYPFVKVYECLRGKPDSLHQEDRGRAIRQLTIIK